MTIVTCSLIYQYGALDEPRVSKLNPGADPTFFVCLLAGPEDVKDPAWLGLIDTCEKTAVEKFGQREYDDLCKAGRFRSPFQFGVGSKPAGTVAYLNLKSNDRPIVFGLDGLRIMDLAAEIYPGCRVRASVRPYAWGGKSAGYGAGVSFGLQNLQKLADGPRLASARADGSEFGAVDGSLASLID